MFTLLSQIVGFMEMMIVTSWTRCLELGTEQKSKCHSKTIIFFVGVDS